MCERAVPFLGLAVAVTFLAGCVWGAEPGAPVVGRTSTTSTETTATTTTTTVVPATTTTTTAPPPYTPPAPLDGNDVGSCADLNCEVAVTVGTVFPVGTSQYRVTRVSITEVDLALLRPGGGVGATATLTTRDYLPVGEYQVEFSYPLDAGTAVIQVCQHSRSSYGC
jgi:hypothetical protein